MRNEAIIEDFYSSFQKGDAEGMVKHYHEDITFEDPAFGLLIGNEAKNMWRMLLSKADDLSVTFSDITASDIEGKAHWEARYTFSKTGRKVHNKIDAHFKFKDGKIIEHKDEFSFWRWSQMALGPFGLFFGFTPVVKKKVRTTARKALKNYIKNAS